MNFFIIVEESKFDEMMEREKTLQDLAKATRKQQENNRSTTTDTLQTQALLSKAEKELSVAVAKLEAEKADFAEQRAKFDRDQRAMMKKYRADAERDINKQREGTRNISINGKLFNTLKKRYVVCYNREM